MASSSSKLPNHLKVLTQILNAAKRFKPPLEDYASKLLLRECHYHISHYWQAKVMVTLMIYFAFFFYSYLFPLYFS